MTMKDKVIFITGGSRGIGKAIALRCAREGAKVAIAAKTTEPHPKLEGTIFTAADEIVAAGGEALPLKVDARDESAIQAAMEQTVEQFGGIDILVNNASAISLTSTVETPMKRFDLMFSVNVRATFACSQAAIPYLAKSDNAHILNLAPPLDMDKKWFKDHVAYTMSKYGMSMCTLGLAEELRDQGIAVNSLWPKTTIATAAVEHHFPAPIYKASRKPEIVADAAHWIFGQPSSELSGQFFIDEEVLRLAGVEDFRDYAVDPSVELYHDLFVE